MGQGKRGQAQAAYPYRAAQGRKRAAQEPERIPAREGGAKSAPKSSEPRSILQADGGRTAGEKGARRERRNRARQRTQTQGGLVDVGRDKQTDEQRERVCRVMDMPARFF